MSSTNNLLIITLDQSSSCVCIGSQLISTLFVDLPIALWEPDGCEIKQEDHTWPLSVGKEPI